MNRKFWFYIEPFVYISMVNDNVLFYNTLNKKHILFNKDNNFFNFIQLIELKKNYVLEIDLSSNIRSFIKKIKKYYMGDIIPVEESIKKPFQFKPIYKISYVDYHDHESNTYVKNSNNTIANIREMTFYINTSCSQRCHFCEKANKQFNTCYSNNHNKELDYTVLKESLIKISETNVKQININGGNVTKYSKFKELLTFLGKIRKNIGICINYLNIQEFKDYISYFKQEGKVLRIYIHPPFDLHLLHYIKNLLVVYNIELIFIIQNEKELSELNKIIDEYSFEDYTIQPLYDNNLSFFKKNVFNTKKDILERKIEMNEIFINNEINGFYYGKLIVMNDGHVYTNPNTPTIGNIISDSMQIVMNNALEEKGSWKKIRKNEEPCNQCVYNVICPPIGNYEHVIGRNNLCKINNTINNKFVND